MRKYFDQKQSDAAEALGVCENTLKSFVQKHGNLAGLSERFGHRIIILTGDLFVTVKVSARSCLTGTFFLLRNWQIQALKKDIEDAKNEEQEGSNGRSASGEGPVHETKRYQSLLNSFYTFQCQCCDAPSSESA